MEERGDRVAKDLASHESVHVCSCDLEWVLNSSLVFDGGASMFCVSVPLCVFVFVCVCEVGHLGRREGGRGGQWREGRAVEGRALELNTRCLKPVGLTACHRTAWLIDSPGMSSPAVLMNPRPKEPMKRAPFAKTVPRPDLS